jgi:hypothetical protein
MKTQSDMGCWSIGEIEILDQNDYGFTVQISVFMFLFPDTRHLKPDTCGPTPGT